MKTIKIQPGYHGITKDYETTNIPEDIRALVKAQANGCYQRALLEGTESWSGATLKGKAQEYKAHYYRSASRLLVRILAALPEDWEADTRLCLLPARNGVKRWQRELVLFHGERVAVF